MKLTALRRASDHRLKAEALKGKTPAQISTLQQRSQLPSGFQILLPYQRRWIEDTSRLKIWEKSRRIGASWVEACASVLAAAQGQNTIYISYNFTMTEQFVRDCEQWVKAFNFALSGKGRKEIVDENNGILGYQIRFKNGRTIKALSSKPRNMRSRQARVIIDEAAFCDNLPELLKAAKALLIWGGSLSVLSTHDGVDNPFNELIEEIKADEAGLGWSLHKTDISQAIAEGLYQRICLATQQEWSLEQQKQWLERIFAEYGTDAEEELLCVPFSGKAGKVFDVEKLQIVDDMPPGLTVRFWDLAATEKDLTATRSRQEPCYTAGVKMRVCPGGKVYVLDMIAVQQSAGAVNDLMRTTAIGDGPDCLVRWELEGGSAGIRDAAGITKNLIGFDAKPVRPQGDKVKRAKPLASQMAVGNVYLMRGAWNKTYKKWLHAFPDGRAKDAVDASSGAFGVLTGTNVKRVPVSSGSSGFRAI